MSIFHRQKLHRLIHWKQMCLHLVVFLHRRFFVDATWTIDSLPLTSPNNSANKKIKWSILKMLSDWKREKSTVFCSYFVPCMWYRVDFLALDQRLSHNPSRVSTLASLRMCSTGKCHLCSMTKSPHSHPVSISFHALIPANRENLWHSIRSCVTTPGHQSNRQWCKQQLASYEIQNKFISLIFELLLHE